MNPARCVESNCCIFRIRVEDDSCVTVPDGDGRSVTDSASTKMKRYAFLSKPLNDFDQLVHTHSLIESSMINRTDDSGIPTFSAISRNEYPSAHSLLTIWICFSLFSARAFARLVRSSVTRFFMLEPPLWTNSTDVRCRRGARPLASTSRVTEMASGVLKPFRSRSVLRNACIYLVASNY